jgi:hypothetical protein
MAQSVTSSPGGDAYVRPPVGWVLSVAACCSVATVRLRWSLDDATDIHCI